MKFEKGKKKYSSVSFDGVEKPSDELPVVEEMENDVNEVETKDDDAAEESAVAKGTEATVQKAAETVRGSAENVAATIKSAIDVENERKVKMILRLSEGHVLTYSELLNHFVVLFDNFNRLREENNSMRSNAVQQMSSYRGIHGYAPSWR